MRIGWEYIAGFFDGEGHLSVRGIRGGKSDGNHFQMGITQKRLLPLFEIQKFLVARGIKTFLWKAPPERASVLHISNRVGMEVFFTGIWPHLILKRQFVQDALRFMKMFPQIGGGNKCHRARFARPNKTREQRRAADAAYYQRHRVEIMARQRAKRAALREARLQ